MARIDKVREWARGVLELRGVSPAEAQAFVQSESFRWLASGLEMAGGLHAVDCEADFEQEYGANILQAFRDWRTQKRTQHAARHAIRFSDAFTQLGKPAASSFHSGAIPLEWLCESDQREVEQYIQWKENQIRATCGRSIEKILGCSLPLTPEKRAEFLIRWRQHPCILSYQEAYESVKYDDYRYHIFTLALDALSDSLLERIREVSSHTCLTPN
jgi:hypothetical protein